MDFKIAVLAGDGIGPEISARFNKIEGVDNQTETITYYFKNRECPIHRGWFVSFAPLLSEKIRYPFFRKRQSLIYACCVVWHG